MTTKPLFLRSEYPEISIDDLEDADVLEKINDDADKTVGTIAEIDNRIELVIKAAILIAIATATKIVYRNNSAKLAA